MKNVYVRAYPYATTEGYISVPDECTTPEEINNYIEKHWNDIEFDIPDLDYHGTDFDWEEC